MVHWKNLLCAVAVFSLPLVVCRAADSPGAPPPASASAATNQQMFQVKGVIQELSPDGKTVTIKHEAVPNYMPAMTMPFDVHNTNELRGLQVGDDITFRLVVTDKEGWIDHILKTGTVEVVDPYSSPFVHVLHDVEPLAVGDALTEYHFTNELGRVISTTQFKGQVVAFTFFFTRCPYPAFCPFLSTSFEDAQKKLQAMTGGPTNWHLISISFDPAHDTPDVLKTYAMLHDYDPSRWSFVTGDLTNLTAFGDQFGEYFGQDGSGGITHNLRTVIVDTRGRVQKIIQGKDWTVDELVAEIVKAAQVKP